jgi:hypothetical protein
MDRAVIHCEDEDGLARQILFQSKRITAQDQENKHACLISENSEVEKITETARRGPWP